MPAENLIAKVSDPTAFFNGVLQLLQEDPRAALTALEAAQTAKLSAPRIHTARILAFIALRDPAGAHGAFHGYLEACRAAGGFGVDPPFEALQLFFDQVNERAWATEVREIAAMECNELFNVVLGSDGEQHELQKVSETLDVQLETAPKEGAEVARTCALKACVLTKLGRKAEALKFWKRAKDAAPDVAEFWSTNSLLA